MIKILIASLFVFLVGSLLHFTERALPKLKFIDIFSATNESTWEHVKILIWGAVIYVFFFILLYDVSFGILLTSLLGILVSSCTLIALYYIYLFLFKGHSVFYDISLFYVCSLIFSVIALSYDKFIIENIYIRSLTLIAWFIFFCINYWFTFYPPRIFLFQCPVSKEYGHKHKG